MRINLCCKRSELLSSHWQRFFLKRTFVWPISTPSEHCNDSPGLPCTGDHLGLLAYVLHQCHDRSEASTHHSKHNTIMMSHHLQAAAGSFLASRKPGVPVDAAGAVSLLTNQL